jgi:hypothetical protein
MSDHPSVQQSATAGNLAYQLNEFAAAIGISRTSLDKLLRKGCVHAVILCGRRLIPVSQDTEAVVSESELTLGIAEDRHEQEIQERAVAAVRSTAQGDTVFAGMAGAISWSPQSLHRPKIQAFQIQ